MKRLYFWCLGFYATNGLGLHIVDDFGNAVAANDQTIDAFGAMLEFNCEAH